MKLRMPPAVLLFLLGAMGSLIGDRSHVATGTTEYFESALTTAVPFVWSSPIWFPVMVGAATVSLAEFRLHLPDVRTTVTVRQGVAGVAAVVGMYVTTALVHAAPTVPATAVIVAMAMITWCALGDNASIVCGLLAAVIGPVVEIVLAEAGVFAYRAPADALFGVGPWLPPLYFAFGVVVALLGELCAANELEPAA
jgi:hypothetical protein